MGKEKVSTCGTNITGSEGTGTLAGDSQGGEHIHFGQSRGFSRGVVSFRMHNLGCPENGTLLLTTHGSSFVNSFIKREHTRSIGCALAEYTP